MSGGLWSGSARAAGAALHPEPPGYVTDIRLQAAPPPFADRRQDVATTPQRDLVSETQDVRKRAYDLAQTHAHVLIRSISLNCARPPPPRELMFARDIHSSGAGLKVSPTCALSFPAKRTTGAGGGY